MIRRELFQGGLDFAHGAHAREHARSTWAGKSALGGVCRQIGKGDMILNDASPKIEVDPESYTAKSDGIHLT
ncbi:MAG TPA: hypothetical protein VK178_03290 [Opitutaceae bacterium]|nr:hypothetical protein [Opitutaceae bacterium]